MSGRNIDVVTAARLMRTDLTKAFPAAKFSVRSSRFAGGEAIDVEWTDGPPEQRVRKIIGRYEAIDRDAHGEILAGGNRYVGTHRSISARARAWANTEASKVSGSDDTAVRRLLERTTFDAQGRPHVSAR